MARRKRLSPAHLADPRAPAPAPETKSMPSAPIARITGDAATVSALEEVSGELDQARRQGRLVLALPLDTILADYLVRDRMASGDAELAALMESLTRRGQQSPIEVAPLEDGRYGLIAGWRRLTALRRLYGETGEMRFATVLAVQRQPEAAADAYLAMVEENEIRVGLSYYERARIVARVVEQEVYPDTRAALRGLFAAASRAKRSKIGAFLPLYTALEEQIRFPAAIPERLGLALSKALETDPGLGPRLCERLHEADARTAREEQAVLARALAAGSQQGPSAAKRRARAAPEHAETPVRGVYLETGGTASRPRLTLSGPHVDAAFREKLIAWLNEER